MKELLRASWVIARRDFIAVVFSRAFVFFLLGPLFPVVVALLAGHLGADMSRDQDRRTVGVALSPAEVERLMRARDRLQGDLPGRALPDLAPLPPHEGAKASLRRHGDAMLAVLSGTLDRPVLTGRSDDIQRLKGEISLLIGMARAGPALPETRMSTRPIAENTAAQGRDRMLTGRSTQVLLFLLTMLLAGMVLSNMVEEKTNKIIEILAAAVPIDAIFIGKLMAMLAVSLVGIGIWGGVALTAYLAWAGMAAPLPAPAVGWPLFLALGLVYFAMAYTLLGSLFIGIGAQATTVREVQTLSLPVTMGQVFVFFLASYAADKPGQPAEIAAALFPLSSPFTMIARAARSAELWPHLLAICWQFLWVAIIIRIGVGLFRRNVLKSGSAGRRSLWRPWKDSTK